MQEGETPENNFPQEESSAPVGPCVLHCSVCRQIIGDTYSMALPPDPFLHTFSLYRASGAVLDEAQGLLTQSISSLPDFGCTYRGLRCKNCGEMLGKWYLTTTSQMDPYRGLYALDPDKLNMYELIPPPSLFEVKAESNEVSQQHQAGSDDGLNELRLEITKVVRLFLDEANDVGDGRGD